MTLFHSPKKQHDPDTLDEDDYPSNGEIVFVIFAAFVIGCLVGYLGAGGNLERLFGLIP